MDYSNEDWDSLDWTSQIWSTMEETRKRAPPAAQGHIKELQRRANDADAYISHMKSMPSLHSCDALSTKTDSTRQGDDADSVDSFKQEGPIWHGALKKWLPITIDKYEAERKAAPKEYGVVKKPKAEATQPKRKAKAKAGPSSTGAASSKEQT